MDRKQDVLGKNEGDSGNARRTIVLFNQKIRAQMQITVIFFVVARRCFNVLDFILIRQGHTVNAFDPIAFLLIRITQINPYRPGIGEIDASLDIDLIQTAILQYKHIDHKLSLHCALYEQQHNARNTSTSASNKNTRETAALLYKHRTRPPTTSGERCLKA